MFNFEQVLKTITVQNQDIESLKDSFANKSQLNEN